MRTVRTSGHGSRMVSANVFLSGTCFATGEPMRRGFIATAQNVARGRTHDLPFGHFWGRCDRTGCGDSMTEAGMLGHWFNNGGVQTCDFAQGACRVCLTRPPLALFFPVFHYAHSGPPIYATRWRPANSFFLVFFLFLFLFFFSFFFFLLVDGCFPSVSSIFFCPRVPRERNPGRRESLTMASWTWAKRYDARQYDGHGGIKKKK